MKRTIYVFISAVLSLTTIACSKNDKIDMEVPPSDFKPLLLERQHLLLTDTWPVDTVFIIEGNGGYRVLQPKQFFVNFEQVDNERTAIRTRITNNLVIFSRADNLSADTEISGLWLLIDSAEQKRIIYLKGKPDTFLPPTDPVGVELYDLSFYPDNWYPD